MIFFSWFPPTVQKQKNKLPLIVCACVCVCLTCVYFSLLKGADIFVQRYGVWDQTTPSNSFFTSERKYYICKWPCECDGGDGGSTIMCCLQKQVADFLNVHFSWHEQMRLIERGSTAANAGRAFVALQSFGSQRGTQSAWSALVRAVLWQVFLTSSQKAKTSIMWANYEQIINSGRKDSRLRWDGEEKAFGNTQIYEFFHCCIHMCFWLHRPYLLPFIHFNDSALLVSRVWWILATGRKTGNVWSTGTWWDNDWCGWAHIHVPGPILSAVAGLSERSRMKDVRKRFQQR